MIIKVAAFTEIGEKKARDLFSELPEYVPTYRERQTWALNTDKNGQNQKSLDKWTRDAFEKHLPILFVGACGIAVRAIAPYVTDKLVDSPVLVMDERGTNIIPILSGHMGGANELAIKLANAIGANPVITTATDVENVFSVDVFARKNGLRIINRDGIRKVSKKLIDERHATIAIAPGIKYEKENIPCELELVPYDSEKPKDILIVCPNNPNCGDDNSNDGYEDADLKMPLAQILLVPKQYVVGMGCKKDKPYEDLKEFYDETVNKLGIEDDICAIASIDLKAKELGLMMLSQYYHVPFITYTAKELNAVEGEFEESEFVKETTGVGSVCERAAVLGAGGELKASKKAKDGMTIAIARREPSITTWET